MIPTPSKLEAKDTEGVRQPLVPPGKLTAKSPPVVATERMERSSPVKCRGLTVPKVPRAK